MENKKILWLTADCFIDVDRQLVPYLRSTYQLSIQWFIVQSLAGSTVPKSDDYEVLQLHHRGKDPRTYFELRKYFKLLHIEQYDLVYSDSIGFYYYPALMRFVRETPLIHAAHNVNPYPVWPWELRLEVKYIFHKGRHFQMFSKHTARWFATHYPQKDYFYAPMVIKDFGPVRTNNYTVDESKVNLLFFGNVVVSGQDFPIHSNMTFDKFFEKNEGKSYMEIESDEYHAKCMVRKYPSRAQPWYLMDIRHRDNRLINLYARIFNFISKHIYWRKMIPGLWGGWNWFTWHRSVAQYVIQQEQTNPSFFRRFHHTSCGDELIFSTLLHPYLKELNIEPHSLRYINWSKKAEGRNHEGSPLTLNEEEYEDIIKSGAFFCRKIDPVISKKLKELLKANMISEAED